MNAPNSRIFIAVLGVGLAGAVGFALLAPATTAPGAADYFTTTVWQEAPGPALPAPSAQPSRSLPGPKPTGSPTCRPSPVPRAGARYPLLGGTNIGAIATRRVSAVALECGLIDLSGGLPSAEPSGHSAEFALTSSAFAAGAGIPEEYSCAKDNSPGNDISPPLAWGAGDKAAKSYAITLVDTDNGNKHWVIFDIPAGAVSLPASLGEGFEVPGQAPAKQRAMGSGGKSLQFFGPCPGGSEHTYEFTLYALDVATLPGITSGSSVAQIDAAIGSHDVASTKLTGTSKAKA